MYQVNIFGLGRVRVQILFGNYLPRSYLPYTKGFIKFGCPEPSKKVFDFRNFCSSKRRLTRFIRVPPYEILVFPTNFIFFQGNEITLRGKKCTALFQTHYWEKSSFFNALVRVFAQIYANAWQGGHNVLSPPGQIGLIHLIYTYYSDCSIPGICRSRIFVAATGYWIYAATLHLPLYRHCIVRGSEKYLCLLTPLHLWLLMLESQ